MSKLRPLRDEDIPVLEEITRHKSEQLGTDCWLPPLRDKNTPCVFVLEEDGQPVAALVFRNVAEMIFVGDEAKTVKGIMDHEVIVRAALDRADVEHMIAFVPQVLMERGEQSAMHRILKRLKFSRVAEIPFEGEVHGAQ